MTGLSPTNRSLIRGLQLLRAFRPGSESLGNGELAEATGLPRATVSRLAQTLVAEGFLLHDAARRTYSLGAPLLGLAFSMRSSSRALHLAAPLMEEMARRERINVGIALADRDEMVYLESLRLSRRKSLRTIMPGQRIPMESTSLGRAWLSTLDDAQREPLYRGFRNKHPRQWKTLERELGQAISDVHSKGYCAASWLPNVVAVACPLVFAGGPAYALNASVTTEEPFDAVASMLVKPLLGLAAGIRAEIGKEEGW